MQAPPPITGDRNPKISDSQQYYAVQKTTKKQQSLVKFSNEEIKQMNRDFVKEQMEKPEIMYLY